MTNTEISEKYKSDHLFLLIGMNPLPNYVAASLLLKPNGTLYLVHSAGQYGTGGAAEQLEKLVQAKQIAGCVVKIEVDEARAADIRSKIEKAVGGISKGTVGLHYTGGTKVMAVHAHKVITQVIEEDGLGEVVCSYLDARNYQLLFDPIGLRKPSGQPVLLAVTVTIEELLHLHNIRLKKGLPQRTTALNGAAEKLAALHATQAGKKAWQKWCGGELQRKAWTRSNLRSETELRNIVLEWPKDDILQPVIDTICLELDIDRADTIALAATTKSDTFKKIRHFCRWLHGLWLEHFVLSQVEQIYEECHLGDWGMSLDTDENRINLNFEFDVAAIRGYQLFAISCSTITQRSRAKSKLFEAYIRARQLGGDEARVGLVCGHPEPEGLQIELAPASHFDTKKLQNELEKSWNAQGKIKVFGPEHLTDLKSHLAEWFKTAQ